MWELVRLRGRFPSLNQAWRYLLRLCPDQYTTESLDRDGRLNANALLLDLCETHVSYRQGRNWMLSFVLPARWQMFAELDLPLQQNGSDFPPYRSWNESIPGLGHLFS